MIRAAGAALVCIALLTLAACGGGQTAHHQGRASPTPAPAPSPSPTLGSAPTASPSAAAPAPAPPSPTATSLIPHQSQSLTLSGAVTGTVDTAEVKECGSGAQGWAMELSSMSVDGGTASLTLLVSPFHGNGSYVPTGALNAILNQQLSTFPVSGGSVVISDDGASGQIDLDLTSADHQKVHAQGSWACA